MNESTKRIKAIAGEYLHLTTWVVAGLALVMLLLMALFEISFGICPLVISVIYAIVACYGFSCSWKHYAKTSPEKLGMFYIGAMTVKLFVALAVVTIYCVFVRLREAVIEFVVIFSIFYIVTLAVDAVFFANVEKYNKINIEK